MAKVGEPTSRPLTPQKADSAAKPAAPQPSPQPAAPVKSGGWLSKISDAVKTAEHAGANALKSAENAGEKALKSTERGLENGFKAAEKAGEKALKSTEQGLENGFKAAEKAGQKALTTAESYGNAALKKVENAGNAALNKVENVAAGIANDLTMKADTVRLSSNGVLSALGQDIARAFDFKTDKAAFQKVSGMSDQQLSQLDESSLASMAHQLLDPTLADHLFGANGADRSKQALRLLTAHGTDPGAMGAIMGKLPYLHDTCGHMKGPAKAELEKLLEGNKAKPGDWAGFDKFLDAATGTKAVAGSKVTPLIDGSKAFPEMYKAIDGAKSSVNLSVYCFQSDKTGWDMAKHLAAAADRGVAVKVIYDPMGSKESAGKKTSDDVYKFMQQHGVQVISQQPTALASHLTHRKITVVDGQTAFTGGMNVGDEYSTLWHDVHSKVEGPAVADLQKLFIQQWKGDGGTVTPQEVTKMMPNLMPVAETSARVLGHEGQGDQNIKQAYLRAIDTAQSSVKIANPYFSDPDVMKALANAAKRGVDVQVVVPHTNDMAAEQNASRANYLDLVNAGVKVYEYAGAPMAHDKVATFDGKMSTIGSSNLDARSLGNNDEANVWTGDPSVAKDLEQNLFARDIGQSTMITKQQAEGFRTLKNRIYQDLSSNL